MDFLKRNIPWIVAFILALLLVGGFRMLFAAPTDFPTGNRVHIPQGISAPAIAQLLADERIIAHPSLFRFFLRFSGTSNKVQAGTYRFQSPQNLVMIMYRLVAGAYDIPPARVTFPEGTSVREMAAMLASALPEIQTTDFLKEAKPYEGYLFPDTYVFSPSSDVASLIKILRENFNTRTATLQDEVSASGYSLSDIVILASIIEKEARTDPNRRMVAGILFNRLELGMPLQVDAVFGYIFGRDTYSPSFVDLAVDSPYNTYTHTGLPPGPINNPGLDSLKAVLSPAKTDYLYYLTGKDGQMHYAKTYAGHLANQRTYLR